MASVVLRTTGLQRVPVGWRVMQGRRRRRALVQVVRAWMRAAVSWGRA